MKKIISISICALPVLAYAFLCGMYYIGRLDVRVLSTINYCTSISSLSYLVFKLSDLKILKLLAAINTAFFGGLAYLYVIDYFLEAKSDGFTFMLFSSAGFIYLIIYIIHLWIKK